MTGKTSASIGSVHTYYEQFINHYKRSIVVAYGLHTIDSSKRNICKGKRLCIG